MHRKVNCIGRCSKFIKIEGFFAYRLPGETHPRFFKGEFEKCSQPSDLKPDQIFIHSFTGNEVYLIKNLQSVKSHDFSLKFNQTEPIVWSKDEYFQAFERVQQELKSGKFKKLILSRIKKVKTKRNGIEIFESLNNQYKNTFNYLFTSEQTGTWLAASPELLLKSENHVVSTMSLAGTKPSDGFSEWTAKEREEQKFVTDFILSAFGQNKIKDVSVSEVYTSKAGPVEHLRTDISGKTEKDEQLYLLLNAMHPTPATCGIPQAESIKKILEIEAHQRKYYAGYIGICIQNTRYFFVNLRCMELKAEKAFLYVGGGITESSLVEREWTETERKAETLIQVL